MAAIMAVTGAGVEIIITTTTMLLAEEIQIYHSLVELEEMLAQYQELPQEEGPIQLLMVRLI